MEFHHEKPDSLSFAASRSGASKEGQKLKVHQEGQGAEIFDCVPRAALLAACKKVSRSRLFGQFSLIFKWKICFSVQAAMDSGRRLKHT
jgi:hypothetical protein